MFVYNYTFKTFTICHPSPGLCRAAHPDRDAQLSERHPRGPRYFGTLEGAGAAEGTWVVSFGTCTARPQEHARKDTAGAEGSREAATAAAGPRSVGGPISMSDDPDAFSSTGLRLSVASDIDVPAAVAVDREEHLFRVGAEAQFDLEFSEAPLGTPRPGPECTCLSDQCHGHPSSRAAEGLQTV